MQQPNILFLFIFLLPHFSYAQNLLPDGSFEITSSNDCVSPDQGFKKMEYWYLLDATPDLFERRCDFNEVNFNFWDTSIQPFDGNNYAGLWSRWNSNDNFFTEGIATRLTQPLEAEKTYLFEMMIQNQGNYNGVLGGSQIDCILEPEKHIDLYIDRDSILVINDFANGVASTTTPIVATLDSEAIAGESQGGWTKVSTCFKAQGGEQYFAVILPLGTFGELPECVGRQSIDGIFQSFYYHIDALSITELPTALSATIAACENEPFTIHLMDLFDMPLLEEAIFEWEDSSFAISRELTEFKTYQIKGQLRCGSIPLTVEVLPKKCSSNIFIPNVFSPNADGINDIFQPLYSEENILFNYEMSILDRWGNLVFHTNSPQNGWNGQHQNQQLSQGIYVWFLQYDMEETDGVSHTIESGSVLLVR